MITFQRIHRIGSLLSQYVFEHTLAVRLGMGQSDSRVFEECCFRGRRRDLSPRVTWAQQWPFESHSGRKIEATEFGSRSVGVISLCGPFQRFDLISEFHGEIQSSWFKLEDAAAVRTEGELLICISCGGHMADKGSKIDADDFVARREDAVLRAASRLTDGEVRRLVGKVDHTDLHWLVDDPGDPMLTRLIDLGGVVHCRGGMEDFRLIHSFQKVAIGQSAFQWWAAFLGAAREIYFPPINRGIWSHPEPADLITDPWWWGIDLRVPNDERYIYGW